MKVCVCFTFRKCCIISPSHPLITGITTGDEKIMKLLFMQFCPATYNFPCSSALQSSPVTDLLKIHCQNVQGSGLCHSKALSNEQAIAMFE